MRLYNVEKTWETGNFNAWARAFGRAYALVIKDVKVNAGSSGLANIPKTIVWYLGLRCGYSEGIYPVTGLCYG